LDAFGLDDKGHCLIFTSYSGKWTPFQTVEDGEWLGSFSHVDLDSRRPGKEIYTGGKKGNLYQIVAHPQGGFDTTIIARFPAQEIHTSVAGDLLPSRPGNEMLVFTLLGEAFDLRPRPSGIEFDVVSLPKLGGRVREALLLPAAAGEAPWVAAACRQGEVLLLRMTESGGLESRVIARELMGLGRIALAPVKAGAPLVLYVTRDDGVILRLERTASDEWTREIIYAGPQGPRGIVAGRFDADPTVETVAVFGYSKRVELLSRKRGEPWAVSVIFEDRDKGHWLSCAELDGRNATDEILASGYGGRLVLLARPPGYGLSGIPTAPKQPSTESKPADKLSPFRVGVRSRAEESHQLSPLRYQGGFEPKTLLYETLVRLGENGELLPSLAKAWFPSEGGRVWNLTLRENETFHDGSPVTAEAVALHFRRWVGLPEHAWLSFSRIVRSIRATSPSELRIELERPHALLPELLAINPAAVQSPASYSSDGVLRWPSGSGPFHLERVASAGSRLLLEPRKRVAGADRFELIVTEKQGEAWRLLQEGAVDIVADGWYQEIPRGAFDAEQQLGTRRCFRSPGSSVFYIAFRLDGVTGREEVRHALARAVDRGGLISQLERGYGVPCPSLFVKESGWPQSMISRSALAPPPIDEPLNFVVSTGDQIQLQIAKALCRQFVRAAIPVKLTEMTPGEASEAIRRGAFDLRLGRSWGVPYDPFLTLGQLFRGRAGAVTAVSGEVLCSCPELDALIDAAMAEPLADSRLAVFNRIQEYIESRSLIVPLYAPDRLAVADRSVKTLPLGPDLYHLDLHRVTRSSSGS